MHTFNLTDQNDFHIQNNFHLQCILTRCISSVINITINIQQVHSTMSLTKWTNREQLKHQNIRDDLVTFGHCSAGGN